MNRSKELLLKLSVYQDQTELWKDFVGLVEEGGSGPKIVSFLNAHAVNLANSSEEFCGVLLNSDLLLRDGIGIKLALQAYGLNPGVNLNGTDLIPKIIDKFKLDIAVFGTNNRNLTEAAKVIEASGVCVIDKINGFQEDSVYLNSVIKYKPKIVLLAMGMPKQEMLADKLRSVIDWQCLIINGGAILDFMSGHISRAPSWMRNIGAEWLYRLLLEPKRLWRRYVIGNARFVVSIIISKFSN